MDLLKKIETLINATTRATLSGGRQGWSEPLEEEGEKTRAAIREALAEIKLRERELAGRLKLEQAQAAETTTPSEQRDHERRAAELERHLQTESLEAINLEEKLAALEERLARMKEQALAAELEAMPPPASTEARPDDVARETPDLTARKSRLSE
jgi:chromosome segregation ATPase